jgi:hypothetical protein
MVPRMKCYTAILLTAQLCLADECFGQMIAVPQDYEFLVSSGFEKVKSARKLSTADYGLARVIAGTWVYVGPCHGDSRKLPANNDVSAMQIVAQAAPDNAYEAATLEMIAILLRIDLGRPSSTLCALALKIGQEKP